jgi:ribose transport system permease protein
VGARCDEFFFTTDNVLNILLQASNIGIVAAGLTVVVITAEIDLSVGSLEALVRAIAAVAIISHDVPVAIGIPLALAVGIVARPSAGCSRRG